MLDRFHAFLLAHSDALQERLYGDIKRELFADLKGTALEIGPGSGINLDYLPSSVTRWIGVEPNAYSHDDIQEHVGRQEREIEVHDGVAESLPLPDDSVDVVISTLVLCTVSDVDQSLQEIQRVLHPEGRFVFIEHVAAEQGTLLHTSQRVLKPCWRCLGNGCNPDRTTHHNIENAGFSWTEYRRTDIGPRVNLIRPHIVGAATV